MHKMQNMIGILTYHAIISCFIICCYCQYLFLIQLLQYAFVFKFPTYAFNQIKLIDRETVKSTYYIYIIMQVFCSF